MLKFIVIIGIGLLTACATGPQLKSNPVQVSANGLSEYWVLPDKSKAGKSRLIVPQLGCIEVFSSLGPTVNEPEGYIVIEFLIDSTGRRHEEQLVEKSDDEFAEELAEIVHFGLSPYNSRRFKSVESNPNQIPVVTQETLFFKTGTELCRGGERT